MKTELRNLPDGTQFRWGDRSGRIASRDEAGCAVVVDLDPLKEGGKTVKKAERLEWSLSTVVTVRKFSLKAGTQPTKAP